VYGKPVKNGPVLINGTGSVIFGKNVNLGYNSSPFFYNSYIYIEARNTESKIELEAGVYINNNTCIISEGNEGIKIGANTLMGTNVTIYDSDFHELHPGKRFTGIPQTAGVSVGKNVFIGSNVTILKGVQIGNNSVIGSGSLVVNSIPENVIAGGNPCRVIKSITL
jgi:maltose O-acetyltransferase